MLHLFIYLFIYMQNKKNLIATVAIFTSVLTWVCSATDVTVSPVIESNVSNVCPSWETTKLSQAKYDAFVKFKENNKNYISKTIESTTNKNALKLLTGSLQTLIKDKFTNSINNHLNDSNCRLSTSIYDSTIDTNYFDKELKNGLDKNLNIFLKEIYFYTLKTLTIEKTFEPSIGFYDSLLSKVENSSIQPATLDSKQS